MLTVHLREGMEFLKKEMIKELQDQGHSATGKLLASIETIVQDKGNKLVGSILLNDYSIYLDKGVKPEKVPYTQGSGAKKSKYIDALIEWAKTVKPTLSERERKSFAFAVARKAKIEGHPTRGSYAYSSNGRRTGWSEYSIDNNLTKFVELLKLEASIISVMDNAISQFTKAA